MYIFGEIFLITVLKQYFLSSACPYIYRKNDNKHQLNFWNLGKKAFMNYEKNIMTAQNVANVSPCNSNICNKINEKKNLQNPHNNINHVEQPIYL